MVGWIQYYDPTGTPWVSEASCFPVTWPKPWSDGCLAPMGNNFNMSLNHVLNLAWSVHKLAGIGHMYFNETEIDLWIQRSIWHDMTRRNRLSRTPTVRLFSCSSMVCPSIRRTTTNTQSQHWALPVSLESSCVQIQILGWKQMTSSQSLQQNYVTSG